MTPLPTVTELEKSNPRKTRPIEERFFEKVVKGDSCWTWLGQKDRNNGYGTFSVLINGKSKNIKAHRFSWTLFNGEIPAGLWVLHKCDNPQCTNPDHLFLGDRKKNMDDAAEKGRICTVGKSRFTHCPQGHEYSEENVHITVEGWRKCKICVRMQGAKRRAKRAAAIRNQP